MIDYAYILTKKLPNAKWSLNGDSYEGLAMLDDNPKPTEEQLIEWDQEIKDEAALTQYQRDRQREYNKQGCTLEALNVAAWEYLVEDRRESALALQSIREAIKAKFPKPSQS